MNIKISIAFFGLIITLISCVVKTKKNEAKTNNLPIQGTWQLLTATLVEKGDTTITQFTKKISFIKIINDSHFAFLQHDNNKGKDSVPVYSSGGGSYLLTDSLYTEHLAYCSDRNWEGNDFKFIVQIKNDTLIQSGVEKVESAGIDRTNIEKYVRVKR